MATRDSAEVTQNNKERVNMQTFRNNSNNVKKSFNSGFRHEKISSAKDIEAKFETAPISKSSSHEEQHRTF